jgi:hypothetical protein
MKKLLIAIMILAMPMVAQAAVRTAPGGTTAISAIASLGISDTLLIPDGATVTVAGHWPTSRDTACMQIYIGGTNGTGALTWSAGARLVVGGISCGGKSGGIYPSSTNGGSMTMAASDTLVLVGSDPFGYTTAEELHVEGANGNITINGAASNTKAIVMSYATGSYIQICAPLTTGIFDAKYTKFWRTYRNKATNGTKDFKCGVDIGGHTQIRDNTMQRIEYCTIDSGGMSLFARGENLKYDTLKAYINQYVLGEEGDNAGILCLGRGGAQDTIHQCQILFDNNATASNFTQGSGLLINSDSCYVYGTTVKDIDMGTGDQTGSGILLNGVFDDTFGLFGVMLVADTVTQFGYGIDVTKYTKYGTVSSCVIHDNNSHHGEGIIFRNIDKHDSIWTIQANQFWGNPGGGILINFYPTSGKHEYIEMKILYNTFNQTSGLYFENDTGPDTLSTLSVVGNLFAGTISNDANTYVRCDQFKKNAYNTLPSNIIIQGSAYAIADSNLTSTTHFAFTDSTNHDYSFGSGSPCYNAGDSLYWAQVFGASNYDPGDIGAYQHETGGGSCTAPTNSLSWTASDTLSHSAQVVVGNTITGSFDSVTYWYDTNISHTTLAAATRSQKITTASPQTATITGLANNDQLNIFANAWNHNGAVSCSSLAYIQVKTAALSDISTLTWVASDTVSNSGRLQVQTTVVNFDSVVYWIGSDTTITNRTGAARSQSVTSASVQTVNITGLGSKTGYRITALSYTDVLGDSMVVNGITKYQPATTKLCPVIK